jgi:hypothetical protein
VDDCELEAADVDSEELVDELLVDAEVVELEVVGLVVPVLPTDEAPVLRVALTELDSSLFGL